MKHRRDECVECGMIPASMKPLFHALLYVLLGFGLTVSGRAQEPEGNARDMLVYKDGDRVQGRLVERTATTIVFQSDRFGELRVPVGNAVVIRADQPAEPAEPTVVVDAAHPSPPAAKPGATAAKPAETERPSRFERFSPAALTAKLRDYFGPWHGKVSVSTEVVSDTADRSNLAAEMQLSRKWKSDEVQLKGRYDFSKTSDLVTTDVVKADGLWRHDFPNSFFALYRPALEWNRASYNLGVPNDYVLLQQEIGGGLSLWSSARRKVRVGLSENLFDVWNTTPGGEHSTRTVESAFLETELKLPWRMSLTQRGVYYYSLASHQDGWEDRIELSKKFTETLSTAIRHEIRRYDLNGTSQDYTRLKLLFGLEF